MTSSENHLTHRSWVVHLLLALVFCTFIPSCLSRNNVRHLASDAILIVPQLSTSDEVISLLGQPDQRRKIAGGTEEWIYFQTKQSFLRKTPYIGTKFGSADFDLIVIHLNAGLVTSSTYRLLTEAEFNSFGIKSDNQLNEK